MSASANDVEDQGDVFLDEDDIEEEINVDEEDLPDAEDDGDSDAESFDLPDAEDDGDSDAESFDEADNSMHIFTGHSGELYTVACSPRDAILVATGGGDDKGFVWKLGQDDYTFELQGHKDSVTSVAFSCDGQLVASGSFDGFVQVWDVSSETLKCTLDGPGAGIEWVRWHPRGHLVLAGSEDYTVWLWNIADVDAVYLTTFSGHASTVTCGDFTPDGKTICTGSDDATLRIWNGEHVHVVRGHFYHTQGLTCLTITADSSLVFTGSKDGSVHVVNISTGKVVRSLTSHTDSLIRLTWAALFWRQQGAWIKTLSSGIYNTHWTVGLVNTMCVLFCFVLFIYLLNLFTRVDNCKSFLLCVCEQEGVTCLSWIGGSRFVGTGCVDGKVRIWDSLSGKLIKTLRGHTDALQSLAVSADGNHLVSVSLDKTARVFKIDELH
ncbi:hypothetical protein LXL04_004964 [Taraxacum kok-saghyz]